MFFRDFQRMCHWAVEDLHATCRPLQWSSLGEQSRSVFCLDLFGKFLSLSFPIKPPVGQKLLVKSFYSLAIPLAGAEFHSVNENHKSSRISLQFTENQGDWQFQRQTKGEQHLIEKQISFKLWVSLSKERFQTAEQVITDSVTLSEHERNQKAKSLDKYFGHYRHLRTADLKWRSFLVRTDAFDRSESRTSDENRALEKRWRKFLKIFEIKFAISSHHPKDTLLSTWTDLLDVAR